LRDLTGDDCSMSLGLQEALQEARALSIRSAVYFLLPAVAEPGLGLAGALGTVPAVANVFFLSALGFLASRLLLF
jgi:hypothetical protein